MTKLTDTQAVILSAASRRPGNRILPLPDRLKGGAAQKVVAGLLARGLAAEADAGREDPVWREADGSPVTLVATEAGLTALGIEPEGAPESRTQAQEGGDSPEAGMDTGTAPAAATGAHADAVALDQRLHLGATHRYWRRGPPHSPPRSSTRTRGAGGAD